MAFLVEAGPREVAAFRQGYEAPTVGQIDPSFVYMHPAYYEHSDGE